MYTKVLSAPFEIFNLIFFPSYESRKEMFLIKIKMFMMSQEEEEEEEDERIPFKDTHVNF